jgi:transcriptional regulator with XRE-family HTH domain
MSGALTPLKIKGGFMNDSQDTGLGRKLAILAKLKGLTQEEIAKQCAMSRISVNRFFRQHTEIRAGDLSALLGTLGINLDQLIDRAIETQMNGSHSLEESIRRTIDQERFTLSRGNFVAGDEIIPQLSVGA